MKTLGDFGVEGTLIEIRNLAATKESDAAGATSAIAETDAGVAHTAAYGRRDATAPVHRP